jgi:hypothetical protein
VTSPIVIDDLEQPRLPWPLRALNAGLAPVAPRIRIDSESLMAAAAKKAGLDDFGPDTFRPGLDALTTSFERDAGLSPAGRLMTRQLLTQLLTTRLRLFDLLCRHPEIRDEPIDRPIFVNGLPRTGTTHLHTTLARDDRLRAMPYWESLEPFPDPAVTVPEGRVDPRVKRCATSLKIQHWAMPLFPAMHEMTVEGPHEEIQLLALEFETMFFEAGWQVPGYVRWYRSSDHRSAYRMLRLMLQAMQWLRGGRRWVLKSPQHLETLPVLLEVFPDAVVVQTHRDPVAVTASLVMMEAYTRRMQHAHVDLLHIGAHWSERIESMLRASVVDRERLPEDRVLDVRFHEFMADQLGTVERILDAADLPLDHAARRAIVRHLEANPRGKHGRIAYDLERFGIDEAERRKAFGFYRERFDVPEESL